MRIYDDSTQARFWAKVNKQGPIQPHMDTRCWEWTGCKNTHGYGNFRIDTRSTSLAHRVAAELTFGPIPEGDHYGTTCVLHRCDNPACVNPAHLFHGSQSDNMVDRERKGRAGVPKGENSARAKLSADDVREIRKLYKRGETQVALADKFGVNQPNISRIVLRQLWRDLDAV